jgi:hypothetical protein
MNNDTYEHSHQEDNFVKENIDTTCLRNQYINFKW